MEYEVKNMKINRNTLMANIGLEKESLRVDGKGRLAQTPHPFPDDSHLDVDFSTNQMEFITGIHSSPSEVYDAMVKLHRKARSVLRNRETGPEYLWPFSNPPYIESDRENPPMQFTGANAWKTEYRNHLRERYGTRLMLYSGIHFNFSFTEDFWKDAFPDLSSEELAVKRNAAYLNMAAWATRYAWLVVYLFAASPVLDPSFFEADDPRRADIEKYASPRCSEIGYWNTFEPVLDYSSLESYVNSILRYTEDGTLMYPAELYYPVRLKPAGTYDMEALRKEGVNHIEIRIIDEDPYSEIGICREDIQFLHILMVYLMYRQQKPFLENEQRQALRDMKQAAIYDDSEYLSNGRSIRRNAECALHEMEGFFRKGAFTEVERKYIREAMDFQWKKLEPGMRRAERVRRDFGEAYVERGVDTIQDKLY